MRAAGPASHNLAMPASNSIAFGELVVYHAVALIHYGIESRTGGRDAKSSHFSQVGFLGVGVLRGGAHTFGAERPPMLIEIAPHAQDEVPKRFEALLTTLEGFGYRLENATTGKPMPMCANELRKLIRYGASIDAVARPAR